MSTFYNALVEALVNGLVNGMIDPNSIDAAYPSLKQGLSLVYPKEEIDDEMVIRHALSNFDVYVGDPSFLDNNKDHEEWLVNEKTKISWNYWNRYKRFLETSEKILQELAVQYKKTQTEQQLQELEEKKQEQDAHEQEIANGNKNGL